jgi:glycosyltransferase involved in cell wall biosynthesis
MAKRRLRILFDAHPLIGKKSGVGFYTSQLIEHMAAQYADELEFVGYYHNFLGRKPPVTEPHAPNIRYRQITLFPGQVVNALRRIHLTPPVELLTLAKADFILYPNYLGLPSVFKTPNAPVIHDLTFVDYPETMSEKNRQDLTRFVPGMIGRSSFIITVSETGKRRIEEVFNVPSKRIYVTPNPPKAPLPISDKDAGQLVQEQGVTKKYLLFLGTIEPRKNLLKLLEAYALLPVDVRHQYQLVIVGKVDWKYAETKQKIDDMQSAGYEINYLGYVDDQTRAALYKRASLFVFPPFYEGFGMPILEAMSYDTPCAISDIPVFKEVAGQAAAYFNPLDAQDMADTITAELTRPSVTKEARQQQLRHFSWSDLCTGLYQEILKSVTSRENKERL